MVAFPSNDDIGRSRSRLYSSAFRAPQTDRHHVRRRRGRRLRAPRGRAVDDEHRHGGRGRDGGAGRRARRARGRSSFASRSTTTTRPRQSRRSWTAFAARDARRRSSATFTTTATSCSRAFPTCARALAKYRINPGNVGGKRRDENFRTIVQVAVEHGKPVRIGVNWGSLDQDLLTQMMDANASRAEPLDAKDVYIEAMLESALRSAALAEETGLAHDRIIISAKVSGVPDLVAVYRRLAATLRLPAAPRTHRSRARDEGDRREHRRAWRSSSARESATRSASR